MLNTFGLGNVLFDNEVQCFWFVLWCFVVQGLGDVDSDGFMEGEVAGKKGLVPSNMVEEITDIDQLQSLVIDSVNSSTSGMYVSSTHTQTFNI